MTSPIDPVSRVARLRRIRRAENRRTAESQGAGESQRSTEVVPLAPGPADPEIGAEAAAAAFAAQLMGQKAPDLGAPRVLDTAKIAYTRTEYSGKADRRAPPGALKDEDI